MFHASCCAAQEVSGYTGTQQGSEELVLGGAQSLSRYRWALQWPPALSTGPVNRR